MKSLFNKISLPLIFAFLFGSFILTAQNSEITIVDPSKPGNATALPDDKIEDSLVFIQDLSFLNSKNKRDQHVLTIQILNFNANYKLLPAYNIDGVEYCDNGKFNDKVAGDGIFTSVSEHRILSGSSTYITNVIKSPSFKYNADFNKFIDTKYGSANKSGIKFGCKVRLIPCPETNWWNSCWPLSSPCSCVEFYDCEVEIEIEFN